MECCQYCDQDFDFAFLSYAVRSKQSVSPYHLYRDGPGPRFRSWCCTRNLSQLSTIRQDVEATTARNLRLTRWIYHCDKPYQRSVGPEHHLVAYAHDPEPPNSKMEESRSDLYLWYRYSVSLSVAYELKHLLMCRCSICTITITRLVIASRLTTDAYAHNFAHDFAKIAIVTDLEPLLGIIVACAPLFPPTLEAMFNHKCTSSPSSILSSGLARLHSKGARTFEFRALDDSYPLTDVEGGLNETHITSRHTQPGSSHQSNAAGLGEFVDERPTITVERSWEVRSELAVEAASGPVIAC